jgi:two-component system, cell cycle sensor histidine kinase and response regulator CckA
MTWHRSVRVRLAALMLVVAVPLIVAHVVQSRALLASNREAAQERVAQAAELMANRTDDWIESANAAFLALADPVRRRWNDREALDSLLSIASGATNQRYVNFFVTDTLGRNRGSGRPTADRDTINFLDRDYFAAALASTGTVVGGPRQSFVLPDRPWVVIVARALREPDGRAYGVIASPVRIDTLTDFLDIAAFREPPLVTVLDTSGVIVARSVAPESYIGRNVLETRPAFPVSTRVAVIPGSDGIARLTATVSSRRAPWLVNVGVPVAAFEAPLRAQQRENLLWSLMAMLVAGAGAVLIGGRIAQPLTTLAADAQQIADGAAGHRADVDGPLEVNVLRDALNRLAETSERRNTALADNERRYRFLFESNPLPMWAWNADTMEIMAVNEATIEHYGYTRDQLIGHPITTLLDPSEYERFGQRRLPFTEDRQNAGTWRHRTADGRVIEMEIIATSTRRLGDSNWLSIGLDVTARRAAERALAASELQLRQSQKMEAVGAFAGGIAHDFNNLLTGIVGFSELALAELASDHPVRTDLLEIRALAERGADLTRHILAVSRKQVLQPTVLEVNAIVTDLERLFTRLVGEDITIVTACDPTLGAIKVDAGQFEQVLLNLVANARDAMPAGGTLHIETHAVPAAHAARWTLAARDWCMVLVRDSGIGMSASVRERVFEPFFTTKERGKGTGLGLALAYAVMQQADGRISCESEPGVGTTFRLFFPVVTTPTAVVTAEPPDPAVWPPGHETILLAEDEESVRTVATAALERCGYRVLAAADGEAALALARACNEPIDLLLSDVVMPGMHGRQLAEQLLAERAPLRVLFASGYTDDDVLLRGIRVNEVPFLQKPFTPSQLVRRVREVLDAPIVPLTRPH